MSRWEEETERYALTRDESKVAEFAGDYSRDAAFAAFWGVMQKWHGDRHAWTLTRVWSRSGPQVLLQYARGVLSGEAN